jgi:hypothetical protein
VAQFGIAKARVELDYLGRATRYLEERGARSPAIVPFCKMHRRGTGYQTQLTDNPTFREVRSVRAVFPISIGIEKHRVPRFLASPVLGPYQRKRGFMKKLFLLPLALFCALQATASTYYLSPSGKDSNAGTSAQAAWLTPKHSLNCGDTVQAIPGAYSASSFASGNWGAVSCPAGINVAWLECETFAGCTVASSTSSGMTMSASYWGVVGFQIAVTSYQYGSGIATANGVNHIVMADNVITSAVSGGLNANGGDYDIIVGNIIYNAAQGTSYCTSAISMWEPKMSDSVAGTHMYVAGNIAWGTEDGINTLSGWKSASCAGTAATDGEGLIFDTFSGYTAQVVAELNMFVFNGGRGIMVNTNGPKFILNQNTLVGNNAQPGQAFPKGLGELTVNSSTVTATGNLAATTQASVNGNPIYAVALASGVPGSGITGNLFNGGTFGSGYGANATAAAQLVAPALPGPPACSGTASTVACAAKVIAAFLPTGAGLSSYGYQLPQVAGVNDALFPQFLCSGGALVSGFPTGVITNPCGSGTVTPPPPPPPPHRHP